MNRVGPAELAADAGRLRLDPNGRPAAPVVVIDLGHREWADWSAAGTLAARLSSYPTSVLVGVSSRPLPAAAAPLLAALTTTLAPDGPDNLTVAGDTDDLGTLCGAVTSNVEAAITLAEVLAVNARATVEDGLVAESLAYSTLLAGPGFAAWRARRPRRPVPEVPDPVLVDRAPGPRGDLLTVTLNRPERRNAFGRAVRDGVLGALEIAALDTELDEVVLRGNGVAFCSGGDLDEFGTAADPASAHLLRLERSAGRAVHHLRDRVRVELHGACIGAGIEIAAFAGLVEAHEDAFFQLPELAMGLVPGAGGTVSLTRRIGRWRTAYLALTGRRIDVATALAWGLVDRRA